MDTAVIKTILQEASEAHGRLAAADLAPISRAAGLLAQAVSEKRLLLAFGNGGSATDAQHFAAELIGRFMRERRPLAAVALSADSAVLTCLGNDYGYDQVFARQIEALAKSGDVCLAITTSGESPNVLRGLEVAKQLGVRTIALTGRTGGAAGRIAEIHINVAEASTARIQEVHRTVLHILCQLVEAAV